MDTKDALRNHRNVSEKTVKWISRASIITMIIVALSSAILSFEGLQSLALASRVPPELAFLFPITIDTTILMGSLAVLRYELVGMKTVFGWFTVLFGTALSVVGNVISVSEGGMTAQILHGIIPILLCISLESLLRILRFNIRTSVVEMSSEKLEERDTVKSIANEEQNQSPSPAEAVLSEAPEKVEVSRMTVVETPEVEAQGQSGHNVAVESTPVTIESKEAVMNPVSSTPIYDAIPAESAPAPAVTPAVEQITQEAVPSTVEPVTTDPAPITQQPEAHLQAVESKVEPPAPVETKAEEIEDPITPEPKTPKKPVAKNVSPLTEKEREKFKMVASKYLDQGHSASKVLAQVFKVNDKITANDVRYIMGYDANKRVDGIVARARKLAKGE